MEKNPQALSSPGCIQVRQQYKSPRFGFGFFLPNRSVFAFGVWGKTSRALQRFLNFQSFTPASFYFLKTCELYFYIFLYLGAQRHAHLNQQTGEEWSQKIIKEPQRNSRTWHLLGMWLTKLWVMVKWVKKKTASFMGGEEQPWRKGFFHLLGGCLAMIIMFQVNSAVWTVFSVIWVFICIGEPWKCVRNLSLYGKQCFIFEGRCLLFYKICFAFLLVNVPIFLFSYAIVEFLLFSGSRDYVVQF